MNIGDKYQDLLDGAQAVTARDILERVIAALAFLGSAWLLWWSLQSIIPQDRQATQINKHMAAQTAELDRFEGLWKKDKLDALTARYETVCGQLFTNRDDYAAWEGDVKQLGAYLGLSLSLKTGAAIEFQVAETNLYAIPVTLNVQATAGPQGTVTPYRRIIRLAERAASGEKRAELVEMAINGSSNSVAQAVFVINLWSLQKEFQ